MYAFSIHPWAILTAGIISFAIGAVWYSPFMFLRPWMRITGNIAEKKLLRDRTSRYINMGLIFIAGIIIALITAFFLENLFVPTVNQALIVAFWLWFMYASAMMIQTIAQPASTPADSWKLFAINAGYYLVVFLVTALIVFSMS